MLKASLETNGANKVDILSFAEPMKQILAATLGISRAALDDLKNSNYSTIESSDPSMIGVSHVYTTAREILQRFGTEGMKPIFGNNVWAELAATKVNDTDANYVIIPDFRFPIEIEPFASATTIKVNRKGLPADRHSSETALNEFKFLLSVDNNGSLKELQGAATTLASGFNV